MVTTRRVQALLPLIDVILLDSDDLPDPADAFERARGLCDHAYVVDLAWLRTTPWRERLAASFDLPHGWRRCGAIAELRSATAMRPARARCCWPAGWPRGWTGSVARAARGPARRTGRRARRAGGEVVDRMRTVRPGGARPGRGDRRLQRRAVAVAGARPGRAGRTEERSPTARCASGRSSAPRAARAGSSARGSARRCCATRPTARRWTRPGSSAPHDASRSRSSRTRRAACAAMMLERRAGRRPDRARRRLDAEGRLRAVRRRDPGGAASTRRRRVLARRRALRAARRRALQLPDDQGGAARPARPAIAEPGRATGSRGARPRGGGRRLRAGARATPGRRGSTSCCSASGPTATPRRCSPIKPALSERARLVVGVPEAGLEPFVPRVTLHLHRPRRGRARGVPGRRRVKAERVARAFGPGARARLRASRASMLLPMAERITVLIDSEPRPARVAGERL